ncbi:hypothetical protein [Mycobacterium avium]|uniref:hypothetical protein n=1 Tax=Mycobacterium avium TaxID=1764 RepID=UPI001593FDD9|nr:hypothetical protein [Mycobacterium avium]
MIDYAELEASIAAVYDAQLSIPPWWPAEERRNFIVEMAGQAACSVMTELDDIVDRAINRACPTQSADALAAAISAEQHVLLAEYRTTVLYDLANAANGTRRNTCASACSGRGGWPRIAHVAHKSPATTQPPSHKRSILGHPSSTSPTWVFVVPLTRPETVGAIRHAGVHGRAVGICASVDDRRER